METLNEWKDMTIASFVEIGSDIASFLPTVAIAIFIMLFGWLFTKIATFILGKILKAAKVDKVVNKINEMQLFGSTELNFKISNIILTFVRWSLFFVFLIVVANVVEWHSVSDGIKNMFGYLPRFISALALLLIGVYLASIIKKAILGVFNSFEFSGGKILSGLVFYLIVIFVAITALNQAGLDTTLITTNISLVIGAFLLALAIGLGLGSKDVISDLLKTFYTRKNYLVGDKIEVNDLKGTVIAIDNACMTLKTKDGKMIIPIKEIVESRVRIRN